MPLQRKLSGNKHCEENSLFITLIYSSSSLSLYINILCTSLFPLNSLTYMFSVQSFQIFLLLAPGIRLQAVNLWVVVMFPNSAYLVHITVMSVSSDHWYKKGNVSKIDLLNISFKHRKILRQLTYNFCSSERF